MEKYNGFIVHGFHYNNNDGINVNFDKRTLQWNEKHQTLTLSGSAVDNEMLQNLINGVWQDESNAPNCHSVYSFSKRNIYDYAEDYLARYVEVVQQLENYYEELFTND